MPSEAIAWCLEYSPTGWIIFPVFLILVPEPLTAFSDGPRHLPQVINTMVEPPYSSTPPGNYRLASKPIWLSPSMPQQKPPKYSSMAKRLFPAKPLPVNPTNCQEL